MPPSPGIVMLGGLPARRIVKMNNENTQNKSGQQNQPQVQKQDDQQQRQTVQQDQKPQGDKPAAESNQTGSGASKA
jgi:hypothetical protein